MNRERSPSTEDVRRALGSLPRHAASAGFTARLLSRHAAAGRPSPRPGIPRLALAIAAGLIVVFGLFAVRGRVTQQREARLAREHAALSLELEALDRRLRQAETIYVGSDAETDLVLSVDALAALSSTRNSTLSPALSQRQGPRH